MSALTSAQWRKSTYSQNGGNCVEVATNFPGTAPVRDSKDPEGPSLTFPSSSFATFLTALKAGAFPAI
ncbi:DUF397 domain-containing protein [Kitasatospora viridis]|uniref:Uncharacterized protein DUF397 n=1 Tax=Kitasatospora viridis TaxID=281105 RepID=A0A561T6Y0_9ACTN|nr:DUF397 domain-containing protein [Kitasatospora viridis]TWF82871.1 uncharacterized protein DUF397 [Kitasatospora viridis]